MVSYSKIKLLVTTTIKTLKIPYKTTWQPVQHLKQQNKTNRNSYVTSTSDIKTIRKEQKCLVTSVSLNRSATLALKEHIILYGLKIQINITLIILILKLSVTHGSYYSKRNIVYLCTSSLL